LAIHAEAAGESEPASEIEPAIEIEPASEIVSAGEIEPVSERDGRIDRVMIKSVDFACTALPTACPIRPRKVDGESRTECGITTEGLKRREGVELGRGLLDVVGEFVGHSGRFKAPTITNDIVTDISRQFAPLETQFVSVGKAPEKTQFVTRNLLLLPLIVLITKSRVLSLKIRLSTFIPQV
jgi:hypothetical protein